MEKKPYKYLPHFFPFLEVGAAYLKGLRASNVLNPALVVLNSAGNKYPT